MTPDEEKKIKRLETRIRQLIMGYLELKKERETLSLKVAEQDKLIESLNERIKQMSDNYTNLKIAKTLSFNEAEQKEARGRLNKLLREVDKCIALLKV